MAAANAVLDVIEDEKLHENVNSVSKYLINELKELQKCYQIIGDVRLVIIIKYFLFFYYYNNK